MDLANLIRMNMWTRNYAAEQKAALDTIAFKRKLARVRANREAKAAEKDKR